MTHLDDAHAALRRAAASEATEAYAYLSREQAAALLDEAARLVAERDELRAVLRPMEDYIVNTARHARSCQRAHCARPVCDTCVCSCGLDAAMRADPVGG